MIIDPYVYRLLSIQTPINDRESRALQQNKIENNNNKNQNQKSDLGTTNRKWEIEGEGGVI